jgi:hypothetical protein
MSERLEHELYQLNGRNVILVRPNFGTQSDSWSGELTAFRDQYPVKFQVASAGQSIIFTVDDVNELEKVPDQDHRPGTVIRLKGPLEYIDSFVHA